MELVSHFVREKRSPHLMSLVRAQSEWPQGYDYAYRLIGLFLSLCSGGL